MNRKGYTPAHVAANATVLQTLYEYGANIFIANNLHRTPLFGAAAKVGTSGKSFSIQKLNLIGDFSLMIGARLQCPIFAGALRCTTSGCGGYP